MPTEDPYDGPAVLDPAADKPKTRKRRQATDEQVQESIDAQLQEVPGEASGIADIALAQLAKDLTDEQIQDARDELGEEASLVDVIARAHANVDRQPDEPPTYTPPEVKPGKRPRATHEREDELARQADDALGMLAAVRAENAALTERLRVWEGNANQVLVDQHNRHQLVLDSMRVELARMVVAMGVTLQHIGIASAPEPALVVDVPTGGLT